MSKIVRGNDGVSVGMDPMVFKGDFDGVFSSQVLTRLQFYASEFREGRDFAPKVSVILCNVLFKGLELNWDADFLERIFDKIILSPL